ncbi:unnamed protein product [Durusdinium trenchii]|uniref:Uncharacterized protein n=1 Tax=Durusdinium trenchii TaxID=1381693 RepID=A0ABP0HJQ8_9DINO
MGVPGFYRWAVKRVPYLRAKSCGLPYEFDNLYLDFNGVVHTCVNDWSLQEQEEFLFRLIEAQLAVLLSIVNPKVLLYIALDGVAPRAKMNQQRSRRFRKAQETDAEDGLTEAVELFDRNAITPGTPFMLRLSERLRSWAEAQAANPDLKGVTIVISCDRDPGEGEHKIMNVIRSHPEHTHCLCSNDADLVLLGLVCRSEHVYLLRTKPNYEKRVRPDSAAQDSDQRELLLEGGSQPAVEDYEMLSIVALRAWLCSQFPDCIPHRLLADFVAMCCLVGNDFLPHMAALDIYDGGLDKLLAAYYQLRPAQHGYLTREDLTLELPRWSGLLEQVAQDECELLLDMVHLGLGPKQLHYRGPGPPPADWDGLSVVVWYVPRKTTEEQLMAAMSKQGCQVRSVHRLKEYKGSSWLVHFSDAQSAVNTIVSTRRIEGRRLEVAWAKPSSLQLEELPEPSTVAEWRSVLHTVVRESFEYWLGPENLPNDAFLRRHVRKRRDRFVPLRVFAAFRRLKIWMQDLTQLADVLRSSEILEVMGEGREAMVRAKEDHSRKPEESKEQAWREQKPGKSQRHAGEHVEAVQKLLPEYNARYSGPVATGSPPAEDAAAVQPGTYQTVRFYPAHYPPLCVTGLHRDYLCRESPVGTVQRPVAPELQLLAVLPAQSAPLLPAALRPLVEAAAAILLAATENIERGGKGAKGDGSLPEEAEIPHYYEVVLFSDDVFPVALDIASKWNIPVTGVLHRDFCKKKRNHFVKDLSKLGRKLDRVLMIDHDPVAFELQPENGILIRPFDGDPSDTELADLLEFLKAAASTPMDLRKFVQKYGGGDEDVGRRYLLERQEQGKLIEKKRVLGRAIGARSGFAQPGQPVTKPSVLGIEAWQNWCRMIGQTVLVRTGNFGMPR